MSDGGNKQRITVETLLHLKRNERPGPEFWDNFEKDFDRRRLNELVNRPSLYDFLLRPVVRALILGMPVTALIMVALFWKPVERAAPRPVVIEQEFAGVEQAPANELPAAAAPVDPPAVEMVIADTGKVANQFVVDAIQQHNQAGMPFRKVLYTPAIRLSVPSGAFYVRDSFSSNNYKVTTADAKLGRNF